MNARIIVDQHERDLAARDLDTTYIVEAAAGTGKTTLLVERVLTIVRERQVPLAQIVAITFTEKAAGELKIKLRKRLELGAQEDAAHAHLYRRALLDLDSMPVSTIHSFCRELIQERPVEAGAEPNFAVADQATADLLMDEVWQEWIAQEFGADCPAARPFVERGIGALAQRGFSLRDVYEVLLDRREDLAELYVACPDDETLGAHLAQFAAGLRADLAVLDSCRNSADLLAIELQKVADWVQRYPAGSLEETIAWLERAPDVAGKNGQQGNWTSKEVLERARNFRRGFAASADAAKSPVVSRWARDLVTWLKGAAEAYATAKLRRGLLDFQDLLLVARNMLRQSRPAREFFKRRFSFILVDEFQDTDPLQAEIVFYLAERPDTFAERWEDADLVPGKLFIVGDPKQSIYRFRRADLDLYGRVREKVEEIGRCVHIRMNFRSLPDILLEVNDVFVSHMTGARNGRYEPDYVALEPYRSDTSADPQAVFLAPPDGWWDGKPKAREQAQAEAACIAEYIREQCTTGCRAYRDIGILYSATTHLGELEAALRARDIPYQVAGGRKLIERGEVIALRAVVAALDNPFDEISVVGALRSPFFACSDEDILQQRLLHGGFNYLRDEGRIAYVEECFAVLRDLHRKKARRAPSETIAELFERTRGLQIYALKPQGDGRVANLLKLLDIARALEGGPACSFHCLASRLTRLEDARAGEEDSQTAEAGDDVVQLLTFHKAKGLEFPVVVLFRIGQERDRKESIIVARGKRTLEFSVRRDFQTAGFALAMEDEISRAECENMRLLYVAMTRAREQLVIPAYWAEHDRGFYKLLCGRYGSDGGQSPQAGATRFRLHDTSAYDLTTLPTETLRIEMDMPESSPAVLAALQKREEWRERLALARERLQRQAEYASPSHHEESQPSHTVSPEHGRGARRFGSFVHRLLERMPLTDQGNLEALARLAAEEHGVRGPWIEDGCRLARQALASDLFTRIRRADAVYRELPFTEMRDGVIWDGVIDLVFIEQGGAVIVDFKTDSIADPEFYRAQMVAYREAFERICRVPVKETLVYFLRQSRIVAIEEAVAV